MAQDSGIKFFKYYSQKLKSFFLSKDILSFLLFFALSGAFWFVNALGKEKETSIVIPIRYINLPTDIAFVDIPPSQIHLTVNDQGLRLLSAYSKGQLAPITIDLNRIYSNKGEIHITSNQFKEKISKYLLPTTKVLEVDIDSLLIRYEKLYSAIIPIQLVSKIDLADQYMLSDKVIIEPSSINVYGPKRILDTLRTIKTELVELHSLNDTVVLRCVLKPMKSVRYTVKDTKLTICVEAFTEKSIQIPVTALSCPENLVIRTFPPLVNLTYNVGLSHFNSAQTNDLAIVLDYSIIKSSKLIKQKLQVVNNTTYISNVRISPSEVEFILETK